MLSVLTVADPILRRPARLVRPDEFGPQMAFFRDQLIATMRAEGGAGLAAPQVGDGRRILVMETPSGILFMVNPVIRNQSDRLTSTKERCLSIPGEVVRVQRPDTVEVIYEDESGVTCRKILADFQAVVVQHEMDHLDGVTLLDKMKHYNRTRYLKRLGV